MQGAFSRNGPALFRSLPTDDAAALLKFAARYLKQVLFGENTTPEKPDAIEKRTKRREEIMARPKEEMRKQQEQGYDGPANKRSLPGPHWAIFRCARNDGGRLRRV